MILLVITITILRLFILPMRNWNYLLAISFPFLIVFLYYLWGIETNLRIIYLCLNRHFLYYLWGIETEMLYNGLTNEVYLFILPMRNWNHLVHIQDLLTFSSLFILPMRNWNQFEQVYSVELSFHLFILPMRNWNFFQSKQ